MTVSKRNKFKLMGILMMCIGIILLIIALSHRLNIKIDIKEIALSLNTYSNLILAFLTAMLVAITAFYAIVTYKMLTQMKEQGQSLVRPILWVGFDEPEFKDSEYPNAKVKSFCTKAKISNYGKGAAVNIRTNCSIPDRWSDVDKGMSFMSSNGEGEIPFLLIPGDSFDMTLGIPTKTYEVNDLHPKYLTVTVTYEDTERNLYELKQSYYLLNCPILQKASYYLHIETESLYFLPLNNRTTMHDTTSISYNGITVFSRHLH